MTVIGITIIFITLSTIIATLLKAIKKDLCLKDFRDYYVTLFEINNKKTTGKFKLEPTGFELIYKIPTIISNDKKESSYILYKNEFSNIKLLARFHDELTEKGKKRRKKELKKSYHPNFLRKFMRKLLNFCKTIKDALMEVINLLLSQVQKTKRARIMKGQDQQISKIKKELLGTIESPDFDPLLENHIGDIVILKITTENETISHYGVLKEYTSEFFEIMDVDYPINEYGETKKADLIVPRKKSTIKHYGE